MPYRHIRDYQYGGLFSWGMIMNRKTNQNFILAQSCIQHNIIIRGKLIFIIKRENIHKYYKHSNFISVKN